MWGNLNAITRAVGTAIEKVQKAANEFENQMDAAVEQELQNDQLLQQVSNVPINSTNEYESENMVSIETIDLQGDLPDNTVQQRSFSSNSFEEISIDASQVTSTIKPETVQPPEKQTDQTAKSARKAKRQPVQRLPYNDDDETPHREPDKPTHRAESIDEKPNRVPAGYVLESDMNEKIEELRRHSESSIVAAIEDAIARTQQKSKETLKTELEKQLRVFEAEKSQIIASYEKKIEAATLKYSQEIHSLKMENDSLKILSQTVEMNVNGDVGEKQTIIALEMMNQQLKANLASSNESNLQLKHEISECSKETIAKQSKINELTVELSSLADQTATLSSKLSATESTLREMERKYNETQIKLKEHESSQNLSLTNQSSLNNEISSLTKALKDKESKISEFETDLMKLKEIISDRERSLNSVTAAMSEAQAMNDVLQQRVSALEFEVQDKDSKLKSFQSLSSSESESKKLILKLQETLKEKEERLAAFEAEGQSLAKRQSEMEKHVRKAKSDVKEKETEIAKLKDSKEQLVKVIEELQDQLRKAEMDTANATKSLNAMQAVSMASSDKLSKLENELTTKIDELSTQRRALETAWAENSELKRLAVELRAERDDARRQLESGVSRVMETESSRRDIEQREAVLRATNKQLQDSLHRQMQESSSREERLREEINEMRKRWQEAIASRETMSTELSAATAPLLRQISSLQENIRLKNDSFQSIETSLTERAIKAENQTREAEHRKQHLEEQVVNQTKQIQQLTNKLNDTQTSMNQMESDIRAYQSAIHQLQHELEATKTELNIELINKIELEKRLKELESIHRKNVQVLTDRQDQDNHSKDQLIVSLQAEVDFYKSMNHSYSNGNHHPVGGTIDVDDALLKKPILTIPFTSFALPSGDASFAMAERMDLQLKQKSDEATSLLQQLRQIQLARDALLEEVNYLSNRNAKLEEENSSLSPLQEELSATKVQNDLLLSMLGEKQEELEAALGDMREVKLLYRHELDELLERIAPSTSLSKEAAS